MIKANELRFGNWINYRNIQIPVTMIGQYGIQSKNGYKLINAKFVTTDLTPIPLTPEILEACGFEEQENGWHKLNICEHYINLFFESLAKAELSISGLGMKMPHIRHLHQLQNLYHALTGEELNYTQSNAKQP